MDRSLTHWDLMPYDFPRHMFSDDQDAFEETAGLQQAFTGVGTATWGPGVYDYKAIPFATAQVGGDSTIDANYSYVASEELVSSETPNVAKQKAQYILAINFGQRHVSGNSPRTKWTRTPAALLLSPLVYLAVWTRPGNTYLLYSALQFSKRAELHGPMLRIVCVTILAGTTLVSRTPRYQRHHPPTVSSSLPCKHHYILLRRS